MTTSSFRGRAQAINRLSDLMAHTTKYSMWGAHRMAKDTGISRSTIWRLMTEDYSPPIVIVSRVAAALEKELNRRIDPRDIVAENGVFLTKFCCDVVGCKGCLPEIATDEWHKLKEIYKSIRPGEWVSSRYPMGLLSEGGIHA